MVQGLTSAKGTYAVYLVVHEKFLTESVCRDVCKHVWIPELTLFTTKLMNFHITYTPCMEFLSTFGWNVWQMHVGKYTIYEAYMSPQPTTFWLESSSLLSILWHLGDTTVLAHFVEVEALDQIPSQEDTRLVDQLIPMPFCHIFSICISIAVWISTSISYVNLYPILIHLNHLNIRR